MEFCVVDLFNLTLMTSKKIYSEYKHFFLGSSLFLATLLFFYLAVSATASVTTPATGGGAISADTTGGTYTTLTGPVLSEGATGDVGLGTIILNVPAGFAFNTIANRVTATVTDGGTGCNSSRRLKLNNSSSQIVTPTATNITVTVTQKSKSSCRGIITWSGIAVRPTSGTPLASGNITESGTSVISGITTSTNFGTLTEVTGAKTHLTFTTQPSTSVLINTDISTKPAVTVKDQFENTVTLGTPSTVSISAKQSSQTCLGTNGSGVITTTPSAISATATSGVLTYTALQYSYPESIKLCAVSTGITSALSNAISVNNPLPSTTSLSPITATSGDSGFTLTVNGSGFVNGSVIRWGGLDRTTTYVSPTRLTTSISAGDIANAETISVAVYNSLPGGGLSNTQIFTINQAPNPLPVTTNISPSNATAGGPSFTLTVSGSGFISSSTVLWGGVSKATTYISANSLTASILAGDISTSTNVSIAISSPLPGGGTSNAQTFTVTSDVIPNPVPVISSISPNSKTVGDSDFTMNIFGSNFISSSVALVNGITRTTTFSSSTELSINFLASELLFASTSSITVFNSLPGGGTSNSSTFTVSSSTPLNPSPILSQLSSNSKMAGALGFTMSLIGSNFIPSSIVLVNNIPRTATYFSPTKLLIDFLTSELVSVISYTINVVNPPLGGGTSTPMTFSVTPASTTVPEITSINPTDITAGSGDTVLTVLGSNFTSSSTIRFDGADQATTFVSATELTTIIPSANLVASNPGIVVTVFNYGITGEGSNSQVLTISATTPVTPSSTPSPATVGGTPDLSVILFTGQAFPGAVVTIMDSDTNTGAQTSKDVKVESDGTFREVFVGVNEAFHGFAVVVKDKDGRLARTKYFTLNTPSSLKKAIELSVPPTVEITQASIRRGDNLTITGYAAPNHIVRIDIDNVQQPDTTAGSDGLYKLSIPSGTLDFGKHDVKVSQTTATSPQGAVLTDYSNIQSFVVSNLSVPTADLNGDGVIDSKDLGIFFSHWISTDAEIRKTVDINNDGKTDLTDFSILIRAMQK